MQIGQDVHSLVSAMTAEDEYRQVHYQIMPVTSDKEINPMNENSAVTVNPFLDTALHMERNAYGTRLAPNADMRSSKDGFLHFSIPLTVAEEAAYQVLEEIHAVPVSVNVSLLRPAHVNAGPILGFGEQVRKGSGILTAQGSAMQGGKQICLVTVSFVRFTKDERK